MDYYKNVATLAGMDQLNESDPHGRVEVEAI
jgi:hypothetical protein